jgi:nondiscriminating aspartyl-tRNA synthetase
MIQSPQLYKQMMVPVFERVYLVSHAYRAEPSVTTRHLSESIQMDLELGFVEFNELLDALEYVGSTTLKHVQETCGAILEEYGVPSLKVGKKIPRLTMREAQQIIKDRTGVDHTTEPDLMPEDEREICRWALEEHDSDLVTITHYPTKKRAFYTLPDPANPEFSLSYDLLFRGLEILSGSQRINKYDDLLAAIKDRGMNPENFKMYLQAFQYGMPPEGGFSFGLERLTMQILQLANVREASLFPRDMERVDFRFSETSNSKDEN